MLREAEAEPLVAAVFLTLERHLAAIVSPAAPLDLGGKPLSPYGAPTGRWRSYWMQIMAAEMLTPRQRSEIENLSCGAIRPDEEIHENTPADNHGATLSGLREAHGGG